jgi:hypothetical protein
MQMANDEARFIEGYAAALFDVIRTLTLDEPVVKSYDPMTVETKRGLLHSYFFDMKDGGGHHPLSDYSSVEDIKETLLNEAIEKINPEAFKKLWYGDEAPGEWTKGYQSGYRAGRDNGAPKKLDGTSNEYRSAYLHGYECGHRHSDV